jgi:putative membrane protein
VNRTTSFLGTRRRDRTITGVVLLLTLVLPVRALAHPGRDLVPEGLWSAWTLDPWVLLGIGFPAWLYARGVGRLWGRAGRGRGIRVWHFWCYCAGLASLAVALISPLHALGGVLFAAHMSQHEVLILISAPLLVLGQPQIAFAWALPGHWASALNRALARPAVPRHTWAAVSHPIGAWSIHAVAVLLWHIPSLYQATLTSEWMHTAQHVSFFGTALLFWYVVLHSRGSAFGYGAAVLLVFTTAMYNSILGALLTFSGSAWYPAYEESAARWGLTALEDQQLGGLIMWIPGGVVYVGAALVLLAAWIRMAERAAARPRDRAPSLVV